MLCLLSFLFSNEFIHIEKFTYELYRGDEIEIKEMESSP